MNISKTPFIAPPETQLVADALAGLRQSTGIAGKIFNRAAQGDVRVSLEIAGKSMEYEFEVKHTVDRFVTFERQGC